MQGANQFLVQIIHPRFTFKREFEVAVPNSFGDPKTTIAIKREKRIADYDMQALVLTAQLLKLSHNIID